MENVKEITQKESVIEANSPKHYKLIVIGLVVGIFGIMLRFVSDWEYINIVSNILFALGSFICLKAVLRILK
ncbi:MAG TPA: hypothetical protein VEV16_12480 [Daejeonella sp.]|nr:hypothetical protein [Daejeonella sp.]